MKKATTLACLGVLGAAVAVDAWAQSGGGGQKVCWFEDATGHPFSRTCDFDAATDCDRWYPVHPPANNPSQLCTAPATGYQACMDVCNSSGEVVDGQCVCGCTDSDEPVHENCIVNP